MTIECYFKECPKHSIHGFTADGPFCYEDECVATPDEITLYTEYRKEYERRLLQQGGTNASWRF